jgi:dolichol-phosphate mannosyltransferase
MTVLCRPAVSVVVRCFDEEDVLLLFLSRVGGALDSLGGTSGVVLGDDGSSDWTWEIIENAAVEDSRVLGAATTERANQPAIPSVTTFA